MLEMEAESEATTPTWMAFADLMTGLLGAFVLLLMGVMAAQLDLATTLEAEVQKRQIEEQKRQSLEQALAIPPKRVGGSGKWCLDHGGGLGGGEDEDSQNYLDTQEGIVYPGPPTVEMPVYEDMGAGNPRWAHLPKCTGHMPNTTVMALKIWRMRILNPTMYWLPNPCICTPST